MAKNLSLVLILIATSVANSFSQISINNTMTPEELVQNVLIGAGINAFNITYNGSAVNAQIPQVNVTQYNAQGTSFPMSTGVLLSTGNGMIAIGPNDEGAATDNTGTSIISDPDMSAITPNTTTNGVVLEFDFTATGDTLNFQYIFASEEYPNDFVGLFYDVFGFFISGPGFTGPYSNGGENIATLPGTSTPISLLNLNTTTNSQYYVSNESGAAYGTAIQYDGTSVILTASASLICGQTYHIKLGISNVGDQSYDSGVFLLAGSFSSNVIDIQSSSLFQGSFTDTLLAEGCTTNELLFIRPSELWDSTQIFVVSTSGTADPDLDFTSVPDTLFFNPGDDTLSIILNPIDDGLTEPMEYIQFMGYSITNCGDTIYDSIRIYLVDFYQLQYNLIDTISTQCITNGLQVEVTDFTNSIPSYQTNWSFGSTDNPATLPPVEDYHDTITYYVEITDGCGRPFYDSVVLIIDQDLMIDSLTAIPTHACENDGEVHGYASGYTGTPNYNWQGPVPGTNNINASAWTNLSPGNYIFTVQDDLCSYTDTIEVEPLEPPSANLSASVTEGCAPLTVTFTNSSENTNTYEWNFGNGVVINVDNLSSQTQTFTESTIVTLTAWQDATCFDVATVPIVVSKCGCTDPAALNFDSTAVIDDGSCVYPAPILLIAPNIFTPNNDGNNDLFFLTFEYAETHTLTILNRWGNVLYSGTGANPTWDGRDQEGELVSEGAYFYSYEAVGIQGDKISGYGFFQLFRD